MKIGLVGFKGSGKSTLFSVLGGGRVVPGGDPAKGTLAVVPDEADEKLRFLVDLWQPKKIVPLSVELRDYPGIAPPADSSGGFRVTAASEDVEGLVLVVRGFTTADYFYPRPKADPAADVRDLVAELTLADLDKTLRREEKLAVSVKKPTPRQEQDKRELALMGRIRTHLEAGETLKSLPLPPDDVVQLKCFGFLTMMPWYLLVSLPDEGGDCPAIEGPFEGRDSIRVRLERELLELDPSERDSFAKDMGLPEFRLPGILSRLTSSLGMIRFYTAYEKEVHVWEVERGSSIVKAAGRIHTDIGRGFIRSEVTACDDVRKAGDMKAAKAAGATRMEGREYLIRDGDIINVLFSK